MKQKYSHILFDHDGVLVDTEALYFAATQTKLAELGVQLSLEEYLVLQVDGLNAWERAAALGVSAAQVRSKRAERNELYQHLLQTRDIDIPGVDAVLTKLKRDHHMAIVTTAKAEDFALIHRHRIIVAHMDFVLTNGDYARSKPAPDPYVAALKRFGIHASQALVVEDSQRGLKAAIAAGIDCATVFHPFTQPQDFSSATYHIQSLAELEEILYD